MEELNDCASEEFDKCYIRLRVLSICYVQHKLKTTNHVFFYEIVDDIVENLIYVSDIFNVPRKTKYFWWAYIRKQGHTVIDRYITKEYENYALLEALEYQPGNDPKYFYRFTKQRLTELITTGSFFFLLPKIMEQDKELAERLQRQFNSFIKTAPTALLLRLYEGLSTVSTRELKSCQTNVTNLWCRKSPGQRQGKKTRRKKS